MTRRRIVFLNPWHYSEPYALLEHLREAFKEWADAPLGIMGLYTSDTNANTKFLGHFLFSSRVYGLWVKASLATETILNGSLPIA